MQQLFSWYTLPHLTFKLLLNSKKNTECMCVFKAFIISIPFAARFAILVSHN